MTIRLFSDITQFEQCLALPSGFYDKLLKEDDWSFVVKLSALFEAACAHILVKRLNTSELADEFAELDHAHSKYGKITMLRKLGLITGEQSTVLRELATLRNKLVHKISNVSFSFAAYVQALNKQQTANFIKAFGHGVAEKVEIGEVSIPHRNFVLQNPKLSLWLTAAEILACLYLEIEVAKLNLQRLALEEYANLTSRSTGPARAVAQAGYLQR